MPRLGRFTVLLLLPAAVFAQITAQTVTVTASQTAAPQPDQAHFSVTLMSGLDKNFSAILAELQGSGISAANFASLYSTTIAVSQGSQPQVGWGFQLSVPLAKIKDTTAALTALAQSIPQNNSGLSLSFQLSNTQVSSPQPANCSLTDLIANARTQALQLTSAAGLVTGMIQSISTSVGPAASCFLTVRFLLGTQLMLVEPASITVTASRALAVLPDQVLITLDVGSDLSAGLDDVTAALQQAGISGATFLGTNTVPVFTSGTSSQPRLQWSFRMTAPLSNTKDTLAAIVAAQQALAKAAGGETLSFFVSGTQVSSQLASAQTCLEAEIVKDAQAQAQAVAAAAGVSAGTILDLSGGNTPALRLGDFVAAPGFVQILNGVVSTTSLSSSFVSTCSLTVTFRLQQ